MSDIFAGHIDPLDYETGAKLAAAEEAVEHLKDRLRKAETERNILAGYLQDIYAHPAATPPILAAARTALQTFNFAVPPRWVKDVH